MKKWFVFMSVAMVMLLTSCGKAREKARANACSLNLKQVGLAMQMFADDNKDCLPPADEWEKAVQAQLGDEKALECPKDKAHYLYFGNGQDLNKIENKSSTILLACVNDHLGSVNVCYCDGLVGTLKRAEFDKAVSAAKDGALPVVE